MTRELLIKVIRELLTWIEKQVWLPAPSDLTQPPLIPPSDDSLLLKMMMAMRKREGWGGPGSTVNGVYYPNGTLSYRNNNPGNVKFSLVGYLPIYEPVKNVKGFASFKDYDTGWRYLRNLILSHARKYPNWSLSTYFREIYAPAEDNNDPASYASEVARAMGVNPFTWPLKNLL